MTLEMVTREWSFMYDVMKTTLSSLLVTIPIYLSIISFLLSYIELNRYASWIIGLCASILPLILILAYHSYVSFVGERMQLSRDLDINKFMERANERLYVAKKKLRDSLILYGIAHAAFIAVIAILNLFI